MLFLGFLGGLLAGGINTLAGSGSVITLGILTEFFGLPANLANGTNRVGTLTQTSISSITFMKYGKLNVAHAKDILIPTILGAIAGVFIALWIPNDQFARIFRFLMLAMLVVVLIRPKRWINESTHPIELHPVVLFIVYFAIGIYGGFIQMGMGVFMLAATVLLSGYEIIRANAIKNVCIAIYTVLVLYLFHVNGLVDWYLGSVLAVGQGLGGYLCARYASKYEGAGLWAYRLLLIVVVFVVVKQFLIPDL